MLGRFEQFILLSVASKKIFKVLPKNLVTFPIVVLFLLSFAFIGGCWSIRNKLSRPTSVQTKKQSISKSVAYPQENFYDYRDNYEKFYDQLEQEEEIKREKEIENSFDETETTLMDVFSGNVTFDQKADEVEYFKKVFGRGDIIMYVYKHIPGKTKYESGYEGARWIVDLDLDVSTFKSLKPGVQTAIFSAIHYIGGSGKVMAELKKIGSKNYAITHSYFQPGMTLTRCYLTYDETNKQIIYIYLDYVARKGDFSYKEYGLMNLPEGFDNFITRFEEGVLAEL